MIINEVRILNSLKGNVRFKIPDPIFISTKEGELFMGYEKIEGISLSQCIRSMTEQAKN